MDENQNAGQPDLAQSPQSDDPIVADDQQQDNEFDNAPDGNDDGQQDDQRPSRADRRFDRMSDRLRQKSAEADYFRDQLLTNQPAYKPLDYTKQQEFDARTLEQDRSQYGTNQYVQGQQEGVKVAKQEMFIDRLELDGERVATKYPVLDPSNPDTFDDDFTSDVNELYLEAVGFDRRTGQVRNTSLRYRDFVDKYMRNLDKVSNSRNADTARNVARQSARTGLRPGAAPRRSNVDPGNPATWRDKEAYSKNKDAINQTIMRQIEAEGLGR